MMTQTNNIPIVPRPKPRQWPMPQTTISPNPWPNLYVPQGPIPR